MKEKSILIIGAGIGGLSAGCYARMNGYRTHILEQHALPGGVCTSWKRRGYTFDGCMHHLSGCLPGGKIYRMWQELGAMPRKLYTPEDLISIENTEGRRFTVFTDLQRLEQHMLELSPADAAPTREFVDAARRFARFSLMEMALASPLEMLKIVPNLGLLGKWGKFTLEQYGARFSDPFLRRAFGMIQYDFTNIPAPIALMFLGGVSNGYLAWPAGGALEFTRSIEKRYLELGGKLTCEERVSKILVKDGRAVGVRLEGGAEERADVVISNADGYATLYGMLEGKYTTPQIDDYYKRHVPERQVMALTVGLGVARDLSREAHALVLWLPQPERVGDESVDRVHFENFAFAPEMSPEGKTALKATFSASYDYWKNLKRQGSDTYEEAKAQAARVAIDALERRFPGIRSQVEVTDVATPLTVERYVGSFHGYQSWPIPNQSMLEALSGKGLSKTLPDLQNFRMVGQWAGGLGLPNVAAMGRRAIETQCREDGKRFKAGI